MMKKRVLSTLITLCMIFALFPSAVSASPASAITIAGKKLTAEGYWKTDASAPTALTAGDEDDYNIYFDGNGNLTLKGATLKDDQTNRCIFTEGGDLTVTLIGETTVTAAQKSPIFMDGSGSLTINGETDSRLTVETSAAADAVYVSDGNIYVYDAHLTVTPGQDHCGLITANGSITIDNSEITVNAAVGASGIEGETGVSVTGGSTVTMNASGTKRLKDGISAFDGILTVTASTVNTAVTGYGIYGGEGVSLSTSSVTADTTGVSTVDTPHAALFSTGNITISGGETKLSGATSGMFYSKQTGDLTLTDTAPLYEGATEAAAIASVAVTAFTNTESELPDYLFSSKPFISLGITPTPKEYNLWVNDEQITDLNLTVDCGEGTAVYDPAQNTLTLNNADITTGCTKDYLGSGIISFLPELEIILIGNNNKITNTGGEGISTYETDSNYKHIRHDLTLSGDGKLTINQNTEYYGYGIYCTGDLALNGVTLDINSIATGLWAEWRLDITDCNIDIDVHSGYYGMVTAAGGMAAAADKKSGESVITVTNSTINIDSTTVTDNPDAAITDSAILVDGADAVGELIINSGYLKLKSSGHTIQGGVDTSDPTDNIPDIFGKITVNGGTVEMETTGTDTKAVTLPAEKVILNNGETITEGALDGKTCTIAQKYEVIVNGSGTKENGAGKYFKDDTVTIKAGLRSNYTFTGWSVNAGGITLEKPTDAETSFTMPSANVTVTANWSYNGGGGGGGGGGGTSVKSASTVPVSGNENTIQATAKQDGGKTLLEIGSSKLNTVIGKGVNTGNVTIDLTILPTSSDTVVINEADAKALSDAANSADSNMTGLTVKLNSGEASFDANALSAAIGGEMTVSIINIDRNKLTTAQKPLAGDRPVYSVTVLADGKEVTDLGGGSMTITVPYTPYVGENTDDLIIWYLSEGGKL